MDFIDWARYAHALEECLTCGGIHLCLFYLSPDRTRVARICVKCFGHTVEDKDAVDNRLPKSNIVYNNVLYRKG